MVYLDNAATTRVSDAVADRVCAVLRDDFGNPSALYDLGLQASRIIESARAVLASALGCAPAEVVFAGSGTEANNMAVLGAARARRAWGSEAVMTGYEHPSVSGAVQALQREGFTVHVVDPGPDGTVDPQAVLRLVNKGTALVACMAVNNETGATLDTAALARDIKAVNRRTAVHCDAVQAFLKHPLTLDGAIDTAALSAHKIHGPKGVGALYVRNGFNIDPVVQGGGQERGLRSGTENTAYIAGFAEAVQTAKDPKAALKKVAALNAALRHKVAEAAGMDINSPADATPYILNISLPGYKSETLLHFLEQRQIYVSNGSACGRGRSSHTLRAMGLAERHIDSALRISFCGDSGMQDVELLFDALLQAQRDLVKSER